MRETPAPGKTIQVRAGEDPSQALERASCGDTVQLQAGARFNRLLLPAKKCDDSHWIIIRTSTADSKLPPEGTRLTPCYAGVTSLPGRPSFVCASTENVVAKLEFDGKAGSGPVVFAPGANHYRLIGLEVTRVVSPGVVYNLIGPDKGTADHLIFDRMWVHGTAQNETVRGVMLSHVRYGAVIDSYFSDFHCVAKTGGCVDSQAVAGGSGDDAMGPFKIENNFLEAAGECFMAGGGKATTTPTDIEIRRNHLFKPLTWLRGQPGFVGGTDGNPFIVKNLFELKNARRVLFEGNVLENNWGGFSQGGFAILMGPKNQGGKGGANLCPSCEVLDVTVRYNTIRHVGGAFQIGNGLSDNKGAAKDGGRYSIHDVVVDDIQSEALAGRGVFAQISTAPGETAATPLHDVRIDHVTALPPRVLFNLGGPRQGSKMTALTIINNLFTAGDKIVTSTGGGPERNCASGPGGKSLDFVLGSCFSTYTFQNNVVIGGAALPKENHVPGKLEDVGFVNPKENFRLSPSSKFKRAASDKKDIGADIDAVEAAIRGVR